MAEGGKDFGYDDAYLDNLIDNDYDDDYEQELEATRPFQPGAASTPYHGGQYEMQTMVHEQEGLPDESYEETPMIRTGSIGDLQKEFEIRQKIKKSVDMIKAKFPRADFESLKIRRGSKANSEKIVAIGVRGGEYKILKDNESDLTKNFIDSFKKKNWAVELKI